MERSEILTVAELSAQLKELFDAPIFHNVTVLGEVKSLSLRKGNCYVTLVDTDGAGRQTAALNVLVFASTMAYTPSFNEGDRLLVRGRLNYYGPTGSLSFVASRIELYGGGTEAARLEALYRRLAAESLFAPERKRPLPRYPHRIGIVTSAEGAAYRDIVDTLKDRFPVSTVLFDAKVQGADGPREIIKALRRAYAYRDESGQPLDALILGRGGGSKSDLMPFNDETVVRTVAASPFPIVTAIGHEIDTTLCDYAGDVQAITPTKAATLVVPARQEVVNLLSGFDLELGQAFSRLLSEREFALSQRILALEAVAPERVLSARLIRLERTAGTLERFNPRRLCELKSQRLTAAAVKIRHLTGRKLRGIDDYLVSAAARLEILNPANILKKGYGALEVGGNTVASVDGVAPGDEITVRLYDGAIAAVATEVHKHGC